MTWSSILFASCVTMVTAVPGCLDVIVSEKDTKAKSVLKCEKASVTSCISKCKQDLLCRSFNYGVKGNERGKCCLSPFSRATSTSSSFSRDESFVYYDMGKVNAINEKEPKLKKVQSKLNTCAREPKFCFNNATCEETCGPEKLRCRCNLANYGSRCQYWKGEFSDFDLFFPRQSVEDYVSQVISPLEQTGIRFHSLSVALWVNPELNSKSVTLLSIADFVNKKTVFTLRLIYEQSSKKLKLVVGATDNPRFKTNIAIPAQTWTSVLMRWSIYYTKSHNILVKTNTGQQKYSYRSAMDIYTNYIVLVGQELVQGSDKFDLDWSFKGSISRLSIWDAYHIDHTPELLESSAVTLTWPMMWDFYGPKIGGQVMKIPHSEVKKEWKAVQMSNIVDPVTHNDGINNLAISTASNPLKITAQINSDCSKSPSYLSITLIAPNGTPKKIRYRQLFQGQMLCYGIFGERLSGSDLLNDSGIYQLDTAKDRIYLQKWMETPSGMNAFQSPMSGCGKSHFWYKNTDETRIVEVSRRCKSSASKFTITTFAKCGIGSITIKDIYFMY